jgi:hypothetical protein
MRYQIIARRMSPPNSRHFQHIVEVRWQAGGQIGDCTRQQMVARLRAAILRLYKAAVTSPKLASTPKTALSICGVTPTDIGMTTY